VVKNYRITKSHYIAFLTMLLLPTLNIVAVNGEETNEWSRVVRLASEAYSWQPDAGRPDVVIDPNYNIHIVWLAQDEGQSSKRLSYVKIDEKGNPESERTLTSHAKLSKPDIELDRQGNIIIVWIEDGQILRYTKFDHSGNSLQEGAITLNTVHADQVALQIGSQNNLHVILRSGTSGAYQLQYILLEAQSERVLYDDVISNRTYLSTPVFQIDPTGKAHIAYWESSQGRWDLKYLARDADNRSVILRSSIGTTVTFKEQNVPSLATDSAGNIHIFWTNQIEGIRVRSSHISHSTIDQSGNRISEGTLTADKTGWPYLAIDGRDGIHATWTDWRKGKMEIYYGQLDVEGKHLVNHVKLSDAPSGSWLPVILIDDDGFLHVFWLEFFRSGVRVSYKNTRNPAQINIFSQFMDTYGFLSLSEMAQGLLLSLTASILIAPVIMFSPSIILGVISVLIIRKIIFDTAVGKSLENISKRKWVFFAFGIVISKIIVLFFSLPLTNGISYQIASLVLSLAFSLVIQRRRKKSLEDVDNWRTTAVIIGSFDGFFTILPYLLAFVTGYR